MAAIASMLGIRSVQSRAVAPGMISSATARIAPTASKLVTIVSDNAAIRL